MFLSEAKQIVQEYNNIFRDTKITSKIAHYDSLLPSSKEKIVLAYKVLMCYVGTFKTMSTEDVTFLFSILNRLHSFVPKDEADHINLLQNRIHQKQEVSKKEMLYFMDFLEESAMCSEHDEVAKIMTKVQNFFKDWFFTQNKKMNDDEYYKYIFEELIGIPYVNEYGYEFYNSGITLLHEHYDRILRKDHEE